MPNFDTSVLNNILLEIVDPRVRELTEKSAILWNLITKGTPRETNFRGVRLVVEARPNPSMLWFAEGGKYPAGGTRNYLAMNVTYARFAIGTRMTRDTLDHKGGKVLLDVLSDSVKSDTKQAMKEFNQQAFGDGSGRKALVSATFTTGAGGTITCDTPFYGRQLYKDGRYNVTSPSGTIRTGGVASGIVTVTAYNRSTGVATFDTVPTDTAAGDYIVPEGSYGIAFHGLDYIIDNGTVSTTFQNVSRTTNPQLNAMVDDAAGAALSLSRLNKMLFQIKYLVGSDFVGTNEFVIISSPTQVHRYASLGEGLQRGDSTSAKPLDLGYTTYKFQNITWIEDVDCPDDKLYFVKLDSINKFSLKDLGVVPLVGSDSALAPIPAFDNTGVGAYVDQGLYMLTAKCDLGSPDPRPNIKIKGLATSGLATGKF